MSPNVTEGDRATFAPIVEHPVVAALTRRFTQAGFELVAVGGCVRDLLCGKPAGDIDLATSATTEEFAPLLGGLGSLWEAGREFGTLGVQFGPGPDDRIEVTTYRGERYSADSRAPEVFFTRNLADDLVRRDFTVNAMAVRTDTGELVDLFGGRQDLEAGLLRTPGDPHVTISDDPLRAVRAVRFSAVRGWAIDGQLAEAIRCLVGRLSIVSRERITAEVEKAFTKGGTQAVTRFVETAQHLGLAEVIFGPLTPKRAVTAQTASLADAWASVAVAAGVEPRDVVAAERDLILGVALARAVAARVEVTRRLEFSVPRAELRALVRTHDPEVIDFAAKHAVHGGLLAEVASEPGVRDPLPVDGHDAMSVGLKGPTVGAALRRVEAEFCQLGEMSYEQALAILEDEAKRTS